MDDDVKALDNVREYAERVRAEVQIGDELQDSSLEGKLKEIKAATTSSRAQAKLAALKAKRAAAQSSSETPEVEKSL